MLFSDLRGFTSFSETQPAARVIDVVNYYLNEMTEAILAAGGTLIAYMGDGIMAVFGAPLEQDDHADRALAAAREMIGRRLDRFNAWLAEQGFERSFEMGVGLNSGTVMAGNVGSEQRVEYTAIGDTTNTASRLEGMTKDSGSDAVHRRHHARAHAQRHRGSAPLVGEFEIRGRTAKLEVWTICPRRRRRQRGWPQTSPPALSASSRADGKLPPEASRVRPCARHIGIRTASLDAPQELNHLAVVDSLRGGRGEHAGRLRRGPGALRSAAAGANSRTSRQLRDADRFRFANVLEAWIEVDRQGRISGLRLHRRRPDGQRPRSSSVRWRVPSRRSGCPTSSASPEQGDGFVRFVQTAGGRTGVPAPRRVRRRPFVQWQAPLVWTTLSLTLHADGRAEGALEGASRFPRHWVYDEEGRSRTSRGSPTSRTGTASPSAATRPGATRTPRRW